MFSSVEAVFAQAPQANVLVPATPHERPPENPADSAAPPPARQLTPAEISTLQSIMTDRAAGMVLTPGNAAAIRNRVLESQSLTTEAGAGSDGLKLRPRSINVDLHALLRVPQTIQLSLGVVTPLTFLDSGGRPWPVASVAFDPRMFAQDGVGCGAAPAQGAAVSRGERPSTVTMMPCRINTWGNISVTLEGYPLPVVLMARSGGNRTVDIPIIIRVWGHSPSAPIVPAEATAASSPVPDHYVANSDRKGKDRVLSDRYLDTFSAGVPPAAAQRVDIDDPRVSGWIFKGKLYLRGSITVINPAQDAVAKSIGGIKVWRFDRPVPRILVIDEAGAERDLHVTF